MTDEVIDEVKLEPFKMNPEVKEKWLVALESGEYEQGSGQLRYKNKFCCLGVLCDIYAKEHPEARWEAKDPDSSLYAENFFDVSNEFHAAVLTPAVTAWAGLPADDGGSLNIEGAVHQLPVFNDGRYGEREEDSVKRRTFLEIAAAIREQL